MGKATDYDNENSNSASITKRPEKEEGRETKGEETSPLMVDLTSAEQLEIEEDGEYYYEDEGESELEVRLILYGGLLNFVIIHHYPCSIVGGIVLLLLSRTKTFRAWTWCFPPPEIAPQLSPSSSLG